MKLICPTCKTREKRIFPSGRRGQYCLECDRERVRISGKRWREKNPEKAKLQEKKTREKNKERISEYNKKRYREVLKDDPEYQEYIKRYREEHKEDIQERGREYYMEHKEECQKRTKEWQEKNRERMREYYEKNKEKVKAKFRQRYKNNPEMFCEKSKRYKKKDPEGNRQRKQFEMYKLRGVEIIDKRLTRETLCLLFAMTCGICGKVIDKDDVTIDHIIPLCKGGNHVLENVQLAHRICNSRKGSKTMDELICLILDGNPGG